MPHTARRSWLDRRPRSALPSWLRSLWFPAALGYALLVAAFAVMALSSWRTASRQTAVYEHLTHLGELHGTVLSIQHAVLEQTAGDRTFTAARVERLRGAVLQLLSLDGGIAPVTAAQLERIRQLLDELQRDPAGTSMALLDLMRQITEAESAAHTTLLRETRQRERRDLLIGGSFALLLFLLAAFLLLHLQRAFWRPLSHLRHLMELLGRREFRTAPTAGVDASLRPMVDNYNVLAHRLEELERQNRDRQSHLEAQVREAARALLLQQREANRVERLAAVGEMAATVAHQVRNPLAGIEVALARLQRELTDSPLGDRIALVRDEARTLARQLDEVLASARTPPEAIVRLSACGLLESLAALARLQLPDGFEVTVRCAPELEIDAPEGGLRQALGNILHNAAEAIAERRPAGPGRLELRAVSRPADARWPTGGALVEVADDGPGFPAELLAGGIRRFGTFRPGGSGIGLATVRRFAADLGGELRLANPPQGGACVSLFLPHRSIRETGDA